MCGRFALSIYPGDLEEVFELASPPPAEGRPRYNIAPTQDVAVVPNLAPRHLAFMRWGLVPFWAKDLAIGNRMINARCETVAEKPACRNALKKRRCLVPATGFFEWRKDPGGKTPMYIGLASGRPFAMAGLWETWKPPDGEEVRSFTIIVCPANETCRPIHDRMPVILPKEAWAVWLAEAELPADRTVPLLLPFTAEPMRAVAVARTVNSPANDTPECLVPA